MSSASWVDDLEGLKATWSVNGVRPGWESHTPTQHGFPLHIYCLILRPYVRNTHRHFCVFLSQKLLNNNKVLSYNVFIDWSFPVVSMFLHH